MQNCQKCGTFDTKNVDFCPVCGWPLRVLPRIEDSGKPIASLVLALVGFGLCGPITAIPAFLMAKKCMAGPLSPRDLIFARIAFWLSIAVVVIWFLIIGLVSLGAILSSK